MRFACTDLVAETSPDIGRVSSACQKVAREFCSARGLAELITDQDGNAVPAIPPSLKEDFIAAFRGRLREDGRDYRKPVAEPVVEDEEEEEEVVAEGVVRAGA
jgi:hypothetical protein